MQILSLSYNRPLQLWLTHASLRRSLDHIKPTSGRSSIIIFDQNSRKITQLLLGRLEKKVGHQVIYSDRNIGMLEGWLRLLAESESEFLLLVENDWFCDSSNSRWLEDATSILKQTPDVAMVKLRKLRDVDDYGKGLAEHQPWTVAGPKPVLNFEHELTQSGSEFYVVKSLNTGFTFNPILIRRTKLIELLQKTVDDPEDPTPLRSGENVIDRKWRKDSENIAAVLDGPFGHIGFHNRRNYLWPFFPYLFRFVRRTLVFWVCR